MKFIFPLALVAVVTACQPIPPPNPPVPDADASSPPGPPDAGPAPEDVRPDLVVVGTACQQACAVLAWLGCPEGTPTPKGETCDVTCAKTQAVPNLALPTACVAKARTIVDVRKCAGVTCR